MTKPTTYAMDKFDREGTKYLKTLFNLIEPDHRDWENWRDEAVGLLVGGFQLTAEDIKAAKKLKYVVRHGVGYDKVDTDACKEQGIIVCNCPRINSISVAELAIGLITSLARRIPAIYGSIQRGEVLTKENSLAQEGMILSGKTCGIIGGGEIGRMTAVKLIAAFSVKIVVYDPFLPNNSPWTQIPHQRVNSLADVLPIIDILSVHAPLTVGTKNLVNMKGLKMLKQEAIVVSTARGGIINETDAVEAIEKGIISGLALDACVHEPPSLQHYKRLMDCQNVIITPHIGAAPLQVQTQLCCSMGDHMLEMMQGHEPRDRVA